MIGVIFATLFQGIFFAGVVMLFVGGLLGKMGIITISSSKTIATWSVILMMVYFFLAIGKNMNEYKYNKRANQVVGTWESKKEDEIISFSDKNEFYSTKKYEYTILTYGIEPDNHKIGIFTPDNDIKPVEYEYKVKGKKLTIKDETGKSIVYKRKSRDFQGVELFKRRLEGYTPLDYKASLEYPLDGIWKDNNDKYYVFSDRSNGREYQVTPVDYDSKTSRCIPLEEGVILAFGDGGAYYDKKIKPNAYTFSRSGDRKFLYGINTDKKELKLCSIDSEDIIVFKFVEEYDAAEMGLTEGADTSSVGNSYMDSSEADLFHEVETEADFDIARVSGKSYINGTDEQSYEISFYPNYGDIYVTINQNDDTLIDRREVQIENENTLKLVVAEFDGYLTFTWSSDDFEVGGQLYGFEDMIGSQFFDTSAILNAS